MSSDLDAIRSERFVEIGNLIEQAADGIVQDWAARARQEEGSADGAHFAELRDGLPGLLRALGRCLASADPSTARHCLIAIEHGEQRWSVGWKLNEVVQDYQILRIVILDALESALGCALSTRESMAVGLALDDAIECSVVAYVASKEQELTCANQKMNGFLATLAHELRNPLAPMRNAIDILKVSAGNAETAKSVVPLLERQFSMLVHLVDDLSDLSRVAEDKVTLRKAPLDLATAIDRAVEVSRSLIDKQCHTLNVAVPESTAPLVADEARLTQILVNLLNNAAKYTPDGGRIALIAEQNDSETIIRVRDNGLGIAGDLLPRIFERFVQAGEALGRAQGGLGIGLSIVHSLVELHGGSVTAASAGAGQGSEFTIRLPTCGQ